MRKYLLRLFGYIHPERNALLRADYCLKKCEEAFYDHLVSKYGSEEYYEAIHREDFYSRNHNRFWCLAFYKPPFRKVK